MRNKRGTLPLKILTVRIAVKLEIRLHRNNFISNRNFLPLKFACSSLGTAIKQIFFEKSQTQSQTKNHTPEVCESARL